MSVSSSFKTKRVNQNETGKLKCKDVKENGTEKGGIVLLHGHAQRDVLCMGIMAAQCCPL
jgi:hypothetical protein